MPTISVDGVEYEVAEGRTVLQALDDLGVLMNGVDIPHYCWHPKLTVDGSCRLCQVEIEGTPKLQIACNTLIQDGMVIHTRSEKVRRAREGVMELLLVNHPLDCPICDQAGECKLQDYAYEYGVPESRSVEPRRALKKKVDLGPTIVFDQERCILCRRCTRFCREIPKTGELGVFNRGDSSVIETFPGMQLDNDYSMNVADICPVGALTTKDFRFKIRVWFLDDIEGICTGCANGCNIDIGVANNKVYRYVPRRNDEVNDSWMCDSGRMTYQRIGGADRIKQAEVRGARGVLEARDYAAAIEEGASRLRSVVDAKGAGAVAAIASPHATNEDLFALKLLLDSLGSDCGGVAVARGESDALLLKEERAANASGARAMGFGDAAAVVERVRAGEVGALLVLGHDLLEGGYLDRDGVRELADLQTVILIDTHHSDLEHVAHVVLPGRHAAEKHGSLTNHSGRVQRVRPAVEPSWEAHDEGESVWRLARSLGLEGFEEEYQVSIVSKMLSEQVPAFSGIGLDSLGALGRTLADSSSAAGP